jgi:diaminohydroxyphosphoribosylaminopyrimidine deaminase/5-amino-6-(5-phosphoribosylamino)uracil reductase
MTLDGKLATRTGSSRWISAPESRAVVHALRGRVDAVMVGAGTVRADDPLLSARPAGVRVATRVVMGDIGPTTQLAATAGEVPLLVATSQLENRERYDSLLAQGGEVLWLPPERCHDHAAQLDFVLAELGRRRMTNILVEGGAQLLGTLFDLDAIDELHVFVAPKLVGGGDAPSPVAGTGIADMASAIATCDGTWEAMGSDIYFQGRVVRPDTANAPQSSTLAT